MTNRLFEEKEWNYYTTVIPIMLFFIIFLTWAAFSEIDEAVKGTGKVVPSGQTKIVQNLEGGIVSGILLFHSLSITKFARTYLTSVKTPFRHSTFPESLIFLPRSSALPDL